LDSDGFVMLLDMLFPSACHEPVVNGVRREGERKKSTRERGKCLDSIACEPWILATRTGFSLPSIPKRPGVPLLPFHCLPGHVCWR